MVPEILILGSGASILPRISPLKPLLASKFTILINYAYKHFNGTFLTFSDRDFYCPLYAKKRPENNPDIYEELKQLPLIIGVDKNGINEFKLDNTILLPQDKLYSGDLTGVFALSLACYLLENKGIIYLLGYDWTRQLIPKDKNLYNPKSNLQIHYYNNINHRGIGLTGYYDKHNPDKIFQLFTQKKDIKIYNVSLESNITIFPKITYNQMLTQLTNKNIDQNILRQEIIKKLK